MKPTVLFPLDVEEVMTHDQPRVVNAKLREGWTLLLVYSCLDGSGGSFAVYVLGKRRVAAAGANPDPEGFDQRNG